MLLHHPTPPAFDGPERRNVMRNHDEIRLWADYVGCGGTEGAAYLYDDAGTSGGIAPGKPAMLLLCKAKPYVRFTRITDG
jgi:hypothetical protein